MFTAFWRNGVITLAAILSLVSTPHHVADATVLSQTKTNIVQANLNTAPDISLDDKIKTWIDTLSKQPGWEHWKNAKWTSNPLGPGMHGWIVELNDNSQAIGYLVVLATEDGDYMLSEYGKGSSPLFNKQTLAEALVNQGMVNEDIGNVVVQIDEVHPIDPNANIYVQRFYRNALEAFWRVEIEDRIAYLDANTGEELPIDQLPNLELKSVTQAPYKLSGSPDTLMLPAFDPYEQLTWVTAEPLPIKQLADLQVALKANSRLTYVSNLYEDAHHVPVTVLGYANWQDNNGTFLVIEQNGERYIPLSTALLLGFFYS